MTDKKAMTGAQRTAKNYKKNIAAGANQIKLWVHPDEADEVKQFAKSRPKTKLILEAINT